MSDIALVWDMRKGSADFSVDANDLELDDGLETSVMLSLFTDRGANPGDVLPDAQADRHGWWGDAYPVVDGDHIGSRLWLLARSKQLPEILTRATEYAREALQWLIDDKVAERVDVESEIVRNGVLGLRIVIFKPKADTVNFRYNYTWASQEARRV